MLADYCSTDPRADYIRSFRKNRRDLPPLVYGPWFLELGVLRFADTQYGAGEGQSQRPMAHLREMPNNLREFSLAERRKVSGRSIRILVLGSTTSSPSNICLV